MNATISERRRQQLHAASKRWRDSHKEYNRARVRRWVSSHREIMASHSRRWYRANRKLIREQQHRYYLNHSANFKARASVRDGLKRAATVNLAKITQWMVTVKSLKTIRCYWCGRMVSTKRIHFDHIIPLSKGGPHSVENLCASCSGCNLSKQNKPIRLWIRVGQQHLEL